MDHRIELEARGGFRDKLTIKTFGKMVYFHADVDNAGAEFIITKEELIELLEGRKNGIKQN